MRVIIFHSIIYLFLYTVCDCDSKVHNWLFFHILFILQYTFCIFSFSLCNVHWLYSDNLRHHHKPSLPRGEHQQCLKWHLFYFCLSYVKKGSCAPLSCFSWDAVEHKGAFLMFMSLGFLSSFIYLLIFIFINYSPNCFIFFSPKLTTKFSAATQWLWGQQTQILYIYSWN